MTAPAPAPEVPFTPAGLNAVAAALLRASEMGQEAISGILKRIDDIENAEGRHA